MQPFLILLVAALGWLAILLTACGVGFLLVAALAFRRFFAAARPAPVRGEAVTLLKPLYGAEPRLFDNLATFLAQSHDAPLQLVLGVQRADDPAIAVIADLKAAHPHAQIDLVIDATSHGASGKLSNLINMDRVACHPIVILSDSDIAVAPDYVAQVLAALDAPGVGAVTCLYRGRGDAGFWSLMAAAGVSYQFLPGATFGVAKQLATPCMGSTIALRRETLDAIGGFARFADVLADDYAIGESVRALGLTVAVPPMLVTHACDEASFPALWRHELRWAATVRDLTFWPYVGSIVGLPLPVAVLAALYWPAAGLALALAAIFARWVVVRTIDAAVGTRVASFGIALLHDFAAFAVYIASFFVRSVDWRGATLTMKQDGRIAAVTEH
ncbi:bacteriohopanetetrol glucosamine biosynthesis glycosyltransferase HpnI [Sphingomonas glacialis]|uniref:Hopanoid biosynthesis associated glycosyl transferase HpnI n=1 Tax=Sphingomonas glacialis TaxID=658225 RepID=A0A502FZN7_9SPHN|nr:bacteriohopanetetrol glucosamine biosynthesis glycosyltransferase HpnI [Sphingomonas glacialis]TPG54939.1 hopanoid biosynthesis associated glycosyl transferase HpnI [Sphingomonas glacialis]